MSETYASFKSSFLKHGCTDCELSKQRTQLVVDRGNPDASVLVVGEAPGADEDRVGQCFVGRAGRKLDEVMREVGLDTNRDMLIVNVVKCRPPKNRPPRPEEARACSSYLDRQIRLFNPKVMVLLGRTALKYFFPENSQLPMSEKVGCFFEMEPSGLGYKIPGILLYHPAYLLYNPGKKAEMIEHLKFLRVFLSREKILE